MQLLAAGCGGENLLGRLGPRISSQGCTGCSALSTHHHKLGLREPGWRWAELGVQRAETMFTALAGSMTLVPGRGMARGLKSSRLLTQE